MSAELDQRRRNVRVLELLSESYEAYARGDVRDGGEELCARIDALDVEQARAALRYLALGLASSPVSADAGELARAIRHGEAWHR